MFKHSLQRASLVLLGGKCIVKRVDYLVWQKEDLQEIKTYYFPFSPVPIKLPIALQHPHIGILPTRFSSLPEKAEVYTFSWAAFQKSSRQN